MSRPSSSKRYSLYRVMMGLIFTIAIYLQLRSPSSASTTAAGSSTPKTQVKATVLGEKNVMREQPPSATSKAFGGSSSEMSKREVQDVVPTEALTEESTTGSRYSESTTTVSEASDEVAYNEPSGSGPSSTARGTALSSPGFSFAGGSAVTNTRSEDNVDIACLQDDECLREKASQLARIWTPKHFQSWCVTDNAHRQTEDDDSVNQPATTTEGLVLLKVPKAASSTMAGMVLRIQSRGKCKIEWKHKRARDFIWPTDPSTPLYRLASLRDPSKRAVSSVFFHKVSFHGRHNKPDDMYLIKQLNRIQPHNYMMNYLAPTNSTSSILGTVRNIMSFYDFLVDADRLDESLLMWTHLTGLSIADVTVVGSKQASGRGHNASTVWYHSGGRCIVLATPFVSEGVQAFLNGPGWRSRHAGDRLLYETARQSLDRTIETVYPGGRVAFEQHLVQFRSQRQAVTAACRTQAKFPCSDKGYPQLHLSKEDCYLRDFGCGYRCVDYWFSMERQIQPMAVPTESSYSAAQNEGTPAISSGAELQEEQTQYGDDEPEAVPEQF